MSNERPQNGVFIVLGAIALILAAVWIFRPKPPRAAAIPAPDPDPAAASPSATINLYLDDSGSMLHFLPSGVEGSSATNYFQRFLDKVDILSNPPGEVGWNGKTHFLTFGAKVTRIDDPHEMSLQRGKFFHASETSIETAIEDHQNIEEGDEQKPEVKVIVTDLYENGGEIEKPAKALVDKYLSSEADPGEKNAVDILAVRNPHDGTVEDMPAGTGTVTLHNAADSMPFYVIVAGPTADVRHVMKVLLDGTGLADAKKKSQGAKEFLFTRTPLPRSTDEMKPGGDGRFVAADDYRDRAIPFMHLSSKTLEMSWPDTVKLPEGVVDLYGNKDNQKLLVKVTEPKPGAADTSIAANWVQSPDGVSAIGDCSHPDLLCKSIDRSKLTKPGTYVLRFDRVVAKRTAALDPDSEDLKDWNIEEANAKAIGGAAKGNKDKKPQFPDMKGLTPDLSKFLNKLDGAMFRAPVPITTYYVYLQAE